MGQIIEMEIVKCRRCQQASGIGDGGENTQKNNKHEASSPNGRIMISTWRQGGGGGEKKVEKSSSGKKWKWTGLMCLKMD